MELKLGVNDISAPMASALLIVPYGIETRFRGFRFLNLDLLIVPYGIETKIGGARKDIVKELLIVPYGIETDTVGRRKLAIQTFNRTLWN